MRTFRSGLRCSSFLHSRSGGHSAAALVHFEFYLVLPLLMVVIGKRFGYPKAGAMAAILVFLSPVFLFDGSSAYIDVALASIVFALFGLLLTWDETRDPALFALIGLLAGFAYAAKMTAFVAIPYAVLFVLIKLLRRRERWLQPVAIMSACIALMAGPWMLKNAVTVANPFSPFANRLFPNPYIRISFEESYREYHRTYEGLKSYWQVPYETTVRGGILGGLLGTCVSVSSRCGAFVEMESRSPSDVGRCCICVDLSCERGYEILDTRRSVSRFRHGDEHHAMACHGADADPVPRRDLLAGRDEFVC